MGCSLKVQIEDGKVVSVTGNTCPRGAKYAQTEAVAPVRTLTTTVRAGEKMVSVKSTQPLPKENLKKYMDMINSVKLETSVNVGDVIIADIDGTGIDIVATKNVDI